MSKTIIQDLARAVAGKQAIESVPVEVGTLRTLLVTHEAEYDRRMKNREQALRFRGVARDLLTCFTGMHTNGPQDMRAKQDAIEVARHIVSEDVL